MSAIVKAFNNDMPAYFDLINENETNETPEQVENRIFNKINEYNGGDDI